MWVCSTCWTAWPGVEIEEGRPELALEYLTITDREWERFGAEPFSLDQADDRETIRAAALAALGARAAGIIAAAGDRPVKTLADRLQTQAGPNPKA